LGIAYPRVSEPDNIIINTEMLLPPLRLEEAGKVKIVKGPNISSLPDLTPPPDALELPILLKLGDNISTDTISPAGARALPFRSNIAEIAKFSYDIVDGTYHDRAMAVRAPGGHAIVGGAARKSFTGSVTRADINQPPADSSQGDGCLGSSQKQSDQASASRRRRSTPITRRAESQTARSDLRNHSYGHVICFPGIGAGSLNIDNYFFKFRR
jgi:hypothetical protein